MKVTRRWIAPLLAFALALPALPASAARSEEIEVRIPEYPVEINGVAIDSTLSEYPVLSYQGITYFPMTWNFSQALGLSVQWDDESGLSVNQDYALHGKPVQDTGGNNDPSKTYTARKPGFPVTVNGKRIDNASEEYPLLEFREVTYFPMTWRFAVDDFKWDISWEATAGFKVISPQRKLFSAIDYDDGQFLYASSNFGNAYYKIAKTLQGVPSLLAPEESQAVLARIESAAKAAVADYTAYSGERTKTEKDYVTFQGIELTSIQPFIDNNNAYYEKNPELPNNGISMQDIIVPLDANRLLVTLVIFTQTHIPAPYTPHTYQTFVVDTGQKKASLIEGFTQPPELLYKNADGSFWIASNAPYEITTRNAGRFGQLVLLGKDGSTRLINRDFQVTDVDVLRQLDGKLLIHVHNNRLYPHQATDRDGFYLIDTAGKAEKRYDPVKGRVFADASGVVYAVDPDKNKITNLSTGQSKLWYDYELEQ